ALHPNQKTDNKDLEAIFHAVCNGYGLALLSADPVYKQLQSVVRHRRNLVKQRARRQTQIRGLMHQCMPGYADVFSDDKFFGKSIAIPVATHFQTAAAIDAAGPQQIAQTLRENKVRFQQRTIDRIVAWSRTAAEPEANHEMLGEQWMDLLQLYRMHSKMIEAAKQKSAHLLVKTPYILLLSVTGINVVSAAELAGEAGPIEHYASVAALNGRAGLYPSRYQSDEVDRSGTMAKNWNRRLRAACLMVARNLIKCHSYYRGMAGLMKHEKVHGRDRECRVANRANRMVFQLVSGRQVWRGKGVDREYLLKKLQTFHHDHKTPLQQIAADLITAADWLPKTTHLEEGQQIAVPKTTRSKNIKTMGELLLPLMIRLGVEDPDRLESDTSEA
ncbi:MAG: transposase, partial [Planctomycetota bacterium]